MRLIDSEQTKWDVAISPLDIANTLPVRQLDILYPDMRDPRTQAWRPVVFSECRSELAIIGDSKSDIDSSDQHVDGWIARIREEFYSNPSVESIFVTIEDGNVDVWVVIPKRDIHVVRRISEGEGRILRMFAAAEHPVFFLDFHVVYRADRSEKDLIPTGAIQLPRQM